MANAKIFSVRLVRKEKNTTRWVEDNISNRLAFVENSGYDISIDQLFELFESMVLPEDIKLQYVHSWDVEPRVGCPDSFLVSLNKEGFVCPDNANKSWFAFEQGTEKAQSRRFYIYHKDCISALKRIIWNETALSKVKWERSAEAKKVIEARTYRTDIPYEWWM